MAIARHRDRCVSCADALHQGRWGLLGHGDLDVDRTVPTKVGRNDEHGLRGQHVVMVACGARHTAAVTTQGGLWMWGMGHMGQLGVHGGGEGIETMPSPALVGADLLGRRHIAMVACGGFHTLVRSRPLLAPPLTPFTRDPGLPLLRCLSFARALSQWYGRHLPIALDRFIDRFTANFVHWCLCL